MAFEKNLKRELIYLYPACKHWSSHEKAEVLSMFIDDKDELLEFAYEMFFKSHTTISAKLKAVFSARTEQDKNEAKMALGHTISRMIELESIDRAEELLSEESLNESYLQEIENWNNERMTCYEFKRG